MRKRLSEILEKLSKSGLTEGFYLTGGTALMLRYEHRISEDLDFFSLPDLSDDRFPQSRLFQELSKIGRVVDQAKGTLIAVVDGVKVSFFSYSYPLLEALCRIAVSQDFPPIMVASDKDIVCAKAVAVAQRGAKKDFFDLHFLMKMHSWSVEDVLRFCQRKYNISEDQSLHLIKSLTYFEDAEKENVLLPDGKLLSDQRWKEIKDFFLQQVKRFVERRKNQLWE